MDKVIIIEKPVTMMQSAIGKVTWEVIFAENSKLKQQEYIEPNMGWRGDLSTKKQIKINFPDLDSAIHFAKEKGLPWEVRERAKRKPKPKSYSDNFKHP